MVVPFVFSSNRFWGFTFIFLSFALPDISCVLCLPFLFSGAVTMPTSPLRSLRAFNPRSCTREPTERTGDGAAAASPDTNECSNGVRTREGAIIEPPDFRTAAYQAGWSTASPPRRLAEDLSVRASAQPPAPQNLPREGAGGYDVARVPVNSQVYGESVT